MDAAERIGTHPLDVELDDTPMLHWLAPTFHLLARRFVQIAPFAAAVVLLTWLTPHMRLAGPFDDSWRSVFDDVLHHVLLTGIVMSGYAVLARNEGQPWGVGALLPPRAALIRLAIVTAAWAAFSWVIGWLLSELLTSSFVLHLLARMLMRFDVYGVYLFILILAPLAFMLASTGVMAHIAAVRGNEPIPELFVQSFRVVFGQPGRFVKSSLVLAGVLVLVLHSLIKLMGDSLIGMAGRNATAVVLILVAAFSLISLPWWFVMERALRPQLGVEDDLDPVNVDGASEHAESGMAASAEAVVVAASARTANAPTDGATKPLVAAAVAPSAADAARARVSALVEAGETDGAARDLVEQLRQRRLGREEFLAGLEALPLDAALLPELAALASQWQSSGRSDDLAWLVRVGLKRDRGFLMDRPDAALAIAQQLAAADQPQLAGHLLLAFVNRHRDHASHRDAGLRLARLLAFHLDNVDGARQLLDRLGLAYPDDVDLARLRTQLP